MDINNSEPADNDDFPVNPLAESKDEDSSRQTTEKNSKSSKVEVEGFSVQTQRQDRVAKPTGVNGQSPTARNTTGLEHVLFEDEIEATNQVANMTDVNPPGSMSTQEHLPFEDNAEASNQVANTTDVSQPGSTSILEHLPNEEINDRLENLQLMLSLYDLFDEILTRNKKQELEALERKRKHDDDKDKEPGTPV